MMRIFTISFICVLMCVTAAPAVPAGGGNESLEPVEVDAEGMGRNSNEAMTNAKRAAVEKGIGTLIHSETEIKNFMVKKDEVFARTEGAVKSLSVISETTGPDGAVTVKIKAIVSKQQINDDLMALHILLESMEKPRVMVLVREDNVHDISSSGNVAENEVINFLTQKGFSLVDPTAVKQLKAQEQVQQALEGNEAAAAAIGTQVGAEVVITGSAVSRVAEDLSVNLGGMKSCQADVSLKVISCATAAVITAKSEHAAAVHISPVSGGAKAIGLAVQKLLDQHLFEKIVATWQDQINNGMPLRVTVSNVQSFKTSKAIMDGIPALSRGVVRVTKRDWNQATGILELEVLYKGNCDGFCSAIDNRKVSEGSVISVTGSSSGSARLRASFPAAAAPVPKRAPNAATVPEKTHQGSDEE
jgi:hypothetical protein